MRRTRTHALALVTLLALAGCTATSDDDAVAVYDGGQVTPAEVDRAILGRPAAQRQPPPGQELASWYGDVAREVALFGVCLREAEASDLAHDPELLRAREESRKQAAIRAFLQRNLPEAAPVTESDEQAFYDQHRDQFRRPGSRLVSQLYKRSVPGVPAAEQVHELEQLRARVLAGESFAELAATHSDSETRHAKGSLGWIGRGQVNPELERTLFSLPVGVPSEPIVAPHGVHLFLVEQTVEDREFSFAEARQVIAERLLSQQRAEAVRRLVGDAAPPGSLVATPEQLHTLLGGGDPAAVVLRVDPFELHLADFRDRLAAERGRFGPLAPPDLPAELLTALYQRELLYRRCVESGLAEDPAVTRQASRAESRALVDLLLRRRALARLEREPKTLDSYYEANRQRFAEPLRLHLVRLSVPIDRQANARLADLERWREELDQGKRTLESVAAELGGSVEDLGWRTAEELAREPGRLRDLALRLQPGQHSPPFRTENAVDLVRLVERQEPKVQPLDAVRDQVRDDYLANHGHDVVEAVKAELLEEARFRLRQDRLERLAAGHRPG